MPIMHGVQSASGDKLSAGGKCGRCHGSLFSGAPVILTSRNFDAHAGKSDTALLVDFWASWCGPCRHMVPPFAAAAKQLEPKLRLGKVDTEAEQALASRYGIAANQTAFIAAKVFFACPNLRALQERWPPKISIARWGRQ